MPLCPAICSIHQYRAFSFILDAHTIRQAQHCTCLPITGFNSENAQHVREALPRHISNYPEERFADLLLCVGFCAFFAASLRADLGGQNLIFRDSRPQTHICGSVLLGRATPARPTTFLVRHGRHFSCSSLSRNLIGFVPHAVLGFSILHRCFTVSKNTISVKSRRSGSFWPLRRNHNGSVVKLCKCRERPDWPELSPLSRFRFVAGHDAPCSSSLAQDGSSVEIRSWNSR